MTVAGRDLNPLVSALLPAGLRRLLATVGALAEQVGHPAYLVGGTVRDLLLGQTNLDLDLVVEGPTQPLAAALTAPLGVPFTHHPAFGTTNLLLPWPSWDSVGDPALRLTDGQAGQFVDLAATRTEHYPTPGALPVVTLGCDLTTDLRRRDYTLNALALSLAPANHAHLIDPYGGLDDLAAGRLVALHPASFTDDPTRLLRGVRLAGRLWLRFAPETAALVAAAVAAGRLAAISGDRRRHELALLLAETQPAAALAFARAHDLLEQIFPALIWDAWLAERLRRSSDWADDQPVVTVRLALLAWRWSADTIERAIAALHLDRHMAGVLQAIPRWRERRPALLASERASTIVALLADLPRPTLAAARLAEDEPILLAHLDRYVNELVQRRPRLDGQALRRLGLPPGPAYRPLLAALQRAVLDGEAPDEAAEWALLRDLIAARYPPPAKETPDASA